MGPLDLVPKNLPPIAGMACGAMRGRVMSWGCVRALLPANAASGAFSYQRIPLQSDQEENAEGMEHGATVILAKPADREYAREPRGDQRHGQAQANDG